MPIFAWTDRERAAVRLDSPLWRELGQLMDRHPYDESERRLAERHGLSRQRFTSDWRFFLPLSRNDTVLELGAGCGADTLALAARAARVVSLVPTWCNADIVQRRAREAGHANVSVAVLQDPTRLPLAPGSVNAIAFDEAADAGFALEAEDWPHLAAAWRRCLACDGSVLVGTSNPRRLARFGPALGRGVGAPPFERWIKRATGRRARRAAGLTRLARAMRAQGFAPPLVLAPLPDVAKIEIVLPIEHGDVVRYCFGRLLRRNSAIERLVSTLASAAVGSGLVSRLVPYYFLVFRAGSA